LKYKIDKQAWLRWILAAKNEYKLCILNYMITSNHIHLLLLDRDDRNDRAISRSFHLAEARIAQEYNKRKKRSGAFWEDRYHATAIETGGHFVNCLTYIDLNMVRAKVVAHPGEWPFSGYYELQQPRQRFRNQLVDADILMSFLGMSDMKHLRDARAEWVDSECRSGPMERDPMWTESVAVGSEGYVEGIKEKLGGKVKGRSVQGANGIYFLQEETKAYLRVFGGKNRDLRPKNTPRI